MSASKPAQLGRARALRKAQTDAERRIWQRLRDRRFLGLKFRRQVSVGPYIVDFICCEVSIGIELDGGQHNEWTVQQYDARRSAFLEAEGFTILRYWNSEVLTRMDQVLEAIRQAAVERRTLKSLLP
ncbi:MAG: endonuclease domain-containing protein [Ahniella sp.]|nr:endonuclease domain-containing protein [Ahniella sp.]